MSRKSVASYGPILMAAWETATLQPRGLNVKCGKGETGRKAAVHLRYRLYMLRTAMKHERHPLYDQAQRVSLHLEVDADGEYVVSGAPADSNLEQLLIASGVHAPEAPDLPDLETTPANSPQQKGPYND